MIKALLARGQPGFKAGGVGSQNATPKVTREAEESGLEPRQVCDLSNYIQHAAS